MPGRCARAKARCAMPRATLAHKCGTHCNRFSFRCERLAATTLRAYYLARRSRSSLFLTCQNAQKGRSICRKSACAPRAQLVLRKE